MSRLAEASGAALGAGVRVAYDPARSIADLKARLAAVRELCESRAGAGVLTPAEVLEILDGKVG